MQTLIVKQWTAKTLPPDWFKPQQEIQKNSKSLEDTVKTIISQVRKDGDKAIIEFVEKFDKTKLSIQALRVSAEEIRAAYCKITPQQLDALLFMKQRVETYQKQQVQPENQINLDGISIKTVLYPLDSVGCYVPGGQAAYPSTVIMTVVPAKVAGVKRIVVCSPTDATGKINDLVIVASDICGVDEVY
ncbi:MAG: histidinol dehydrogenase, partial [Candidatus Bathyarchaeota archaeon]|nr:histidinol dehydrogenase [Candidatus Termiticorpusculum sp.]